MENKIQEVFGQYAVELEDGVKLFNTYEEAAAELAQFENGAEYNRLANAYCADRGLEGKNAKGKINVIVDFLAWADTQDTAEAVEETEEDEDNIVF